MKSNEDAWFIIANPAAGGGKVKKEWPLIQEYLTKASIPYDQAFTTKRLEAIDLVQNAIKKGYRKIIGIGGDGTNNEIINGIMLQQTVPSHDVLYTLLSKGTGNDWVRTHRIPNKTASFVKYLKTGTVGFQDIGLVKFKTCNNYGERYFANVAGMAYDAFLVKTHNKSDSIIPNKITYLVHLLSCLIQYKKPTAIVRFNELEIKSKYYSINIGICKYSGGGMRAVPHAQVDKGVFGITLFKDISKIKAVANTHRLYNGTVLKINGVDGYDSNFVTIKNFNEEEIGLEVDGEYIGEVPAEFQLKEKALKILLP